MVGGVFVWVEGYRGIGLWLLQVTHSEWGEGL